MKIKYLPHYLSRSFSMNALLTRTLLNVLFYSLSISAQPVLVFLKGTGCAGKTSIGNTLQAKNWHVIDEDAFFYEEGPLYWKTLFPEEFISIEQAIDRSNIFHAVVRNQILFKHSTGLPLRQQVLRDIQHIRSTFNIKTEKNI